MKLFLFLILCLSTQICFCQDNDVNEILNYPDQHLDKLKNGRINSPFTPFSSETDPCQNFYEAVCSDKTISDIGDNASFKETIDDSLGIEQSKDILREILNESHSELSSKHLLEEKLDFVANKYCNKMAYPKIMSQLNNNFQYIIEYIKKFFILKSLTLFRDNAQIDFFLGSLSNTTLNIHYPCTSNGVFDYSSFYAHDSVFIGGNQLRYVKNIYALFFIMAHEIGHKVFNITKNNHHISYVKNLISHYHHTTSQNTIEEFFADSVATEAMAMFIQDLEFSNEQKTKRLQSVLRNLCGYNGSIHGHPTGKERIETFGSHPEIRKIVCHKTVEEKNQHLEKIYPNIWY